MKDDPDAAVAAVVEILQFAFGGRLAPDDPTRLPNVIFLAGHGMIVFEERLGQLFRSAWASAPVVAHEEIAITSIPVF